MVSYLLQTPIIKQTGPEKQRFVLSSSGGRVGSGRVIMPNDTMWGRTAARVLIRRSYPTRFSWRGLLRGRGKMDGRASLVLLIPNVITAKDAGKAEPPKMRAYPRLLGIKARCTVGV